MSGRRRPAVEAELQIERLAAGGDGVAHQADGRVVFVPGTAPGDLVRVRIVDARKRWARAELVEVLQPSPYRREPACADFDRCGGCAWQHISYPKQLEAKREILRDALQRVGGLRDLPEIALEASPAEYGYRTRARLRSRNGELGHLERRSHRVVVPDACAVLVKPLEAARKAARVVDVEAEEWELAIGESGAARLVPLPATAGEHIAITSLGHRISLGPGVFFQGSGLLREKLAGDVCRAVGGPGPNCGSAEKPRLVLELFAGAGFFTLPLAACCERVLAVESHPGAARDLAANLSYAGIHNVGVIQERVERALPTIASPPDVVFLDPPRGGLEPEACDDLAALGAARIVYVSCDAATLARDLARITRAPYTIERITAYDLFPQTPHVESLAVLQRNGESP